MSEYVPVMYWFLDGRCWFHGFGNPHAIVWLCGIEWTHVHGDTHPTVSKHGLN